MNGKAVDICRVTKNTFSPHFSTYLIFCGFHLSRMDFTDISHMKCYISHLILYILESNPHPFYSFRGLKNQMRIRITCGLDSRSWAGVWKNDRAAVCAIRTIQYNNLLFIILCNIYNLLFIRLAVITHNWIVIRHPVTIIFIFTIVLP